MNGVAYTGQGKPVPEDVLWAYVEAVAACYLDCQRLYRPECAYPAKEHQVYWNRIVLSVLDYGDPCDYLKYAFTTMVSRVDRVYPSMLAVPWLIAKWIEEKPNLDHQFETKIKLQAEYVEFRLKQGFTLEQILMDDEAPLTSAFRFALASSEKKDAVAARYKEAAMKLVTFEPLYKKWLGAWLPEGKGHG